MAPAAHREIGRDRAEPWKARTATDMTENQPASRGCAPWPKDALRIGFGVIWLIDAILKWLPGFRAAGPARYSADYYLEQKISWWWRVAELRRPVPAVAARAPGTVPVPPGAIPAPAPPMDDEPARQPRTA
jgi:hypothetical protein